MFASSSTSQYFLFEAPPELRQVGGCFRNCIDDTQTGFSGQGGETTGGSSLVEEIVKGADELYIALTGGDTTDETTDETTDDPNVSSSEIICKVSTSVSGVDSNGVQVINRESGVFSQNEVMSLDLVNPTNNKIIESLNMVNKLTCNISGNTSDLENISVKSSALKTTIFGLVQSGAEKEIWNDKIINSNSINLSDNQEKILSSQSANVNDIHKYLPRGDYQTTIRIQTTGDIILVNDSTYKTATITIGTDNVITNIDLDVVKNSEPTPEPPVEPEPPVKPLSLIEEFTFCLNTLDTDCLMNQKFLPFYIGGVGFIFLIGAVGTRNKPMFDQFGNRV